MVLVMALEFHPLPPLVPLVQGLVAHHLQRQCLRFLSGLEQSQQAQESESQDGALGVLEAAPAED